MPDPKPAPAAAKPEGAGPDGVGTEPGKSSPQAQTPTQSGVQTPTQPGNHLHVKAAADDPDEVGELHRLKAERAALKTSLDSAVGKYKALLLATNPGIPEELVNGVTIEDLDQSLDAAKKLADKIRKANTGGSQVPAGAPARTGIDVDSLSANAKIRLGLRR